jgi:putative cardiolipin synthase
MQIAYFVPGERGARLFTDMAARGVRVRILTNSLASTDVPAVHAGYSRYRKTLLAGGVELHEYRPDASRPAPSGHRMRLGRSESALHAKVIVHDRSVVWIGSANFDPRSRRLNTEAGLLIESRELAGRLLQTIERDFDASHSWRLLLETDPVDAAPRITWNGVQDGQVVRLDHEPNVGLLRQLGVLLFSLLPIEDML